MKILNVNNAIDLSTGGGTGERTFKMTQFLAKAGLECSVLTLDINIKPSRIKELLPATVSPLKCLWRRFYVPSPKISAISQVVAQADIIHLMGHWSILNGLVYLIARRINKPYVVCPAGALPFFGRSKMYKKFYNWLIGNAIIQNAAGWIAVTDAELPHFSAYGIAPSLVTVIPNGVDEVDYRADSQNTFLEAHQLLGKPIILFMGRLNEIKGPDLLMEAFSQIGDQIIDFHLVFAGPDGGLLSNLKRMAIKAGLVNRTHFLGYVEGKDKSALYRAAKVLVVPSRQEAMSIVAIEAGICGTPTLLTDQCGFGDIRAVDKRLEVPANSNAISSGLLNLLLSNESDLEKIGLDWQKFVESRYTWNSLVPNYLKLYGEIFSATNSDLYPRPTGAL